MHMDHLDMITCELPQMNLMRRHIAKLPTSRDMVKAMKEGRLLELVSKDVLADTESHSDEEDAAYAEKEVKGSTSLPKEYLLQGSTGEPGNSTDATRPSALELAPLRPMAGHSVEDAPILDRDGKSGEGDVLPTIASGRGPTPTCDNGWHGGKPSGASGTYTEPRQLGPTPDGRLVGVQPLPDAIEVEEIETRCGPLPNGAGPLMGLNKPIQTLKTNPVSGGGDQNENKAENQPCFRGREQRDETADRHPKGEGGQQEACKGKVPTKGEGPWGGYESDVTPKGLETGNAGREAGSWSTAAVDGQASLAVLQAARHA